MSHWLQSRALSLCCPQSTRRKDWCWSEKRVRKSCHVPVHPGYYLCQILASGTEGHASPQRLVPMRCHTSWNSPTNPQQSPASLLPSFSVSQLNPIFIVCLDLYSLVLHMHTCGFHGNKHIFYSPYELLCTCFKINQNNLPHWQEMNLHLLYVDVFLTTTRCFLTNTVWNLSNAGLSFLLSHLKTDRREFKVCLHLIYSNEC